MMSGAVILAAATLAVSPPAHGPGISGFDVTVVRPAVRLGEVLDLSGLPQDVRSRVEDIVLVRFRPGQTRLGFSTRRLYDRSRALAPALGPWLPTGDQTAVVVRLAAADQIAPTALCAKVTRPVARGQALSADAFKPALCGDAAPPAVARYDGEARLLRASRALEAGEIVVAPSGLERSAIMPGDRLTLVAVVGPVRIERQVEALQAADRGDDVFVRTDGGAVFSARAGDVAP